ncbi:MAG: glycosyltransferase family 4 protein [Planctomycetota bacterium]
MPSPDSTAFMEIVCVIHSLNGGGAERVMAQLASRLSGRGHRITLVTLDRADGDRHRVDDKVQRVALDVMFDGDRGKARQLLRRVSKLRRAIKDLRPDVVLSFCDRTNVLTLASLVGTRIPVVVSERSDPSQQIMPVSWERLRRWLYPKAKRVIALTKSAAEYLQPLCSSRPAVIGSGIELDDETIEHAETSRSFADANRLILGIGRLEPEKGFDRLIDAFATHTRHGRARGWKLRILGEGSCRDTLEQRINELDLTSQVELPGWVQPVTSELARATMFVLPSHYEGFPSALLEAMACGVPSIATDCESGPRALIDSPQKGLLAANTVAGIEEAIGRLIDDPDQRRALGVAATEVRQRFAIERMVDQYESVLLAATR